MLKKKEPKTQLHTYRKRESSYTPFSKHDERKRMGERASEANAREKQTRKKGRKT